MGYSPKHAKPASLKDAARGTNALLAINAPSTGRHSSTTSAAATSMARREPDARS